MKIRTLFIVLALIPGVSLSNAIAGTDIYKYVDKDGNITFTNRRISNAQKISIASFSRSAEQSGLPSKSPRVKDVAQKERDAMRRQILEKELVAEEKLFSDAQHFLLQISNNGDSANKEKAVQLRNKLFLHQRNITALKKELAKL
ncbi:DUF4124 domain-containing protein [Nitrosomonas sp. Nm166]|uniref:DUF4124 domain-containing protein n=1 Tax=Nitrosomonas sp. Nm166 TaxID=1881054 RepID=UPI0008EFB246|nr:DUF4124 domain-containing protein [Nitrosomonas sp. Nm166]SFE65256.1 protein of unknown function [Nitrosomonas sp. Nm166]